MVILVLELNTSNEKFDNNGKCTCSPCCNGKSDENSEACRRLSIAGLFKVGL